MYGWHVPASACPGVFICWPVFACASIFSRLLFISVKGALSSIPGLWPRCFPIEIGCRHSSGMAITSLKPSLLPTKVFSNERENPTQRWTTWNPREVVGKIQRQQVPGPAKETIFKVSKESFAEQTKWQIPGWQSLILRSIWRRLRIYLLFQDIHGGRYFWCVWNRTRFEMYLNNVE